ncbi:hypothetical protein Q73_07995 [Bacillus coahuilensis m2-6]|uniref:Cell wall elongation regulator TseB-like domain-containing protein n=1 Tax=Bacillus coahuilensis p1.1.43 TaxID=1150625 RepID=A0A147K8T9_9BACI|nr:DUF5590 domain-containing protein [Bacillus coahuilensis]KUP06547.1 hypothetical protein Q75_08470 [Bacillus coahuilensis p1.1.43]KUP08032.1 hypothetical protein Q73_07995 [Bacillus coahuilensis m2-6]
MKKSVLIISVLIIVVFSVMAIIYSNARKPYVSTEEKAREFVVTQLNYQSTQDIYIYHGTETILSVVGINENGEKEVAWFSEDGQSVETRNWADGISKDEAKRMLLNEKPDAELLSVTLGMEKVGPIWELSYLDEDNHLNYYYIVWETGDWWRKIENL